MTLLVGLCSAPFPVDSADEIAVGFDFGQAGRRWQEEIISEEASQRIEPTHSHLDGMPSLGGEFELLLRDPRSGHPRRVVACAAGSRTSAGSPRCRKIRWITDNVISARGAARPPRRGQAKTSTPN